MTKKEFLKLENWIFDAYKDSLSQDLNKDLENSQEIVNIFPLFHPSVMSRTEIIQNSNISNITKGLLIQKRAPCGFQIRNAS